MDYITIVSCGPTQHCSSSTWCVQGTVPGRRPPCGVPGGRPGSEGEIGETEGPGTLPVYGQKQRRDTDPPVQIHGAR